MDSEREGWTPTEALLGHIWSNLLDMPLEDIEKEDSFTGLGGDSILMAELIYEMKQKWRTVTNISALASQQLTLTEMAAHLNESCATEKNGTRHMSQHLQPDYLSQQLAALKNPTTGWKPKSQILITGTTGYLGASLLMELLQQTQRNVYCLIRASSDETAKQRLADRLSLNEYLYPGSEFPKRVICLAADISKENFGLSKIVYESMASGIDVVYHCAAEVNLLKTFEELEGSNIEGTRQILKFVTHAKIKPLHYVSTVGVSAHYMSDEGLDQKTVFREERLGSSLDLSKYITGYSQTKAVAELLVWKLIDMGHPAVIYRPGEIGCHSSKRIINPSDFLSIMLRCCQDLQCYPKDFNWKFAYGSLDFITDAIVRISMKGEDFGKVFHLVQTNLEFSAFFNTGKSNGLKQVSWEDWVGKLLMSIDSKQNKNSAAKLLSLFLFKKFYNNLNYFELSNSHAGNFSNENTLAFLEKLDINTEADNSFLTQRYAELIDRSLAMQ